MDASIWLGASPWTTCTRWELTSGARNDVWTTNVTVALPPVCHVGELHSDSDKTMADCQSNFDNDLLPNQSELAMIYNFVN